MRASAAANYRLNAKPVSKKVPVRTPLKLVEKKNKVGHRGKLSASLFLVVCGILALIITPVMINTQLAVLSYEISDATLKKANLDEENQVLKIRLLNAANPARVSKIAKENGLIPAGPSGIIKIGSGEVVKGHAGEQSKFRDIVLLQDQNAPQGVPDALVNVDDVYNGNKVVKANPGE